MQSQCTSDNPGEAAIAEYVSTIMALQDRLCQASARGKALEMELAASNAKIAELTPKPEPKLASMSNEILTAG